MADELLALPLLGPHHPLAMTKAFAASAVTRPFRIREVFPRDLDECEAFFRQLSQQDVRMRFGLLRLSAQHRISELVRPNPGIAFAALDAAGTILGILSLGFQGGDIAEIAVTVRSDCKRRGIGRALLEYGIEWAERHGLTQLIGYVLAENRAMLALAHRMGFQAVLADPYHLELRRSVPRDETLRIRHSGWSCGAGRSSASDPGLS